MAQLDFAQRALEWVEDGQILGLGTGRAAVAFIRALGERVAQGLRIRGVPTSESTARLARELDIPLLRLDEAGQIDITFDGADEVDDNLDLIKGYGAAHVREKIVASASKKLIILVGSEKLVPVIGTRGKLPVEVLPFAEPTCSAALRALGCEPERRLEEGSTEPLITDNGNLILDCKVAPIEAPAELDRAILSIPGVLGTGLFIGMADAVIIGHEDHVEVRERSSSS